MLTDILEKSNPKPSDSQKKSLKKVSNDNCRYVIGGQQVHLFGGPAMVFHKIQTIIETANKTDAVPIFWLQNEDHDYEEIRKAHLYERSFSLKKINENKKSVNFLTLDAEIEILKEQFISSIPNLQNSVKDAIRKHYSEGNSLSKAFQGLMQEIFQDEGLLFFNPNESGVKELLKPIYTNAFEDYRTIEQSLLQASKDQQVKIRKNSPLFFLHPDGKEGKRYRIELDEGGWICIGSGKILRDSEILEIINDHPEQISSSALLRPIIQNFLFKNNVFIGGEAELKYLEQIEPLYQIFSVNKSIENRLRKSKAYINEDIKKVIQDLNLELDDFENNSAIENIKTRSETYNHAATFKKEFKNKINSLTNELEIHVTSQDSTLKRPVEKTKYNINKSLDKLFEKYENAILRESGFDEVKKIQEYLCPGGKPQERVISGLYFLDEIM